MKMESNGSVPVGTYAMLEKASPDYRDTLVTTNCELSLESLRSLSLRLMANGNPDAPNQWQYQYQNITFKQTNKQTNKSIDFDLTSIHWWLLQLNKGAISPQLNIIIIISIIYVIVV